MARSTTHAFTAPALAAALALVAALAVLAPSGASAQLAPAVEAEAALRAPLAIDLVAITTPAGDGHWRGGILLDEGFRAAIRLDAVPDQEIASRISDVTLVSAMVNALAIDAILVPAIVGDGELVWRAAVADVLALGVTIATGEIVKRAVGRARPFERDCEESPSRSGCDDPDRFLSFFSGHSAVAFTSAGFSCAMHLERGLYGDPAADATACSVSLALATATGILRIVADRHYLSDVLVGATLGLLVGFLIPLAIVPEIQRDPAGASPSPPHTQAPPARAPIGLHLGGSF